MRAWTGLVSVLLLATAGCKVEASDPSASPASREIAPAPAGAGGGEVMAYVNDRPIAMSTLQDLLIGDHGLRVAQAIIAANLVDQEAAKHKVTVTAADIQEENDHVLQQALLGRLPAENERERLIHEIARGMGLSRSLWDMAMRRQAIMRKLAAPHVTVGEDELKDEFNVQYDRKVTVRNLQLAKVQDADRLLKLLEVHKDPAARQGKFIELAKKFSVGVTASKGGLLDPISARSGQVPPAVREAATAMTRVGELSGIVQSGTAFHILYCVRIEEPQGVTLEEVREKLVASVRQRKATLLQREMLLKLIRDAERDGRIRYVHPVLKAQDEERRRGAAPLSAP